MTKKPAAEVARLVAIGFLQESQRRAKSFVTHDAHPEKPARRPRARQGACDRDLYRHRPDETLGSVPKG